MTHPSYDPSSWPWVRTCQACDHKISQAEPSQNTKASPSYAFRKCPKCGSEAFDHGSHQPWTEAQKAEYRAFEDWENAQPPEYFEGGKS